MIRSEVESETHVIATLGNGIRLIHEKVPQSRSVSVGVWAAVGSRHETPALNGVSHFIEHMMFKGTARRDAREIAVAIDRTGGQINAFTCKECTCYYARTLGEHLGVSLDVLSDIYLNSRFGEKDIVTERNVILDEIGMYEDTPEELVHDLHTFSVWEGDPLGYPVLGTEGSLSAIGRAAMLGHVDDWYTAGGTVISVAGDFDEEAIVGEAERHFGMMAGRAAPLAGADPIRYRPARSVREKDTEQTHFCLGFPGVPSGVDEAFALAVLSNVIGGSMGSRLTQRVREDLGLAYSIYSYVSSYRDAGLFTVYGAVKPDRLRQVLDVVSDEIGDVVGGGVKDEELRTAAEQLKGGYLLGLECMEGRMLGNGKAEAVNRRVRTHGEVISAIESVTRGDVEGLARGLLRKDAASFTAIGAVGDVDVADAMRGL
ncbi:MAG: insulinase family protein [Oscillospiraceae bacterium]|nr:insulinase family protein [Oscillospiraceae bacterium]